MAWLILAHCRQGAPEINWNLCPSRVATHDQRDDHCTEPTWSWPDSPPFGGSHSKAPADPTVPRPSHSLTTMRMLTRLGFCLPANSANCGVGSLRPLTTVHWRAVMSETVNARCRRPDISWYLGANVPGERRVREGSG